MTHVYAFDDLRGRPLAEVRKIIGSKAANLAAMANELGLPVPPGFAVSTAACREYLAHGWPEGSKRRSAPTWPGWRRPWAAASATRQTPCW